MRTVLSGICLLLSIIVFAQRECASSLYLDQQKSFDPSLSNKLNEIERFISNQNFSAKANGEFGPVIIKIPVVIHVLYSKDYQNISDAQIQSQIDALNKDFRRRNADTVNTPERFKQLAADVQIEFALATADPKGRATTGVIRKQTSVKYWSADDKIKFSSQGGDDAWDSHSYLNFWVGDLSTLLGYSSAMGGAAEKDGVVINYTTFGTINISGVYNLGRTATHEVGHWLGLKHIWGDTYCGDDAVDDTPKQGNFTAGCPSGFRSSCSNGTMGDMYMNYMDFTNDACMNLFTQGQKQRMLALFSQGGPRASLLSSKGLSQPWNFEAPAPEVITTSTHKFSFYPNPTSGEIVLQFEDADWIGKTVSIISVNGTVLSRIQIGSKAQRINIASLKAGMYFIQGENGDQKIREKLVKL
jgi:hypothetical protein